MDNRKCDKDRRIDTMRTGQEFLQNNYKSSGKIYCLHSVYLSTFILIQRLHLPECSKTIAITTTNIYIVYPSWQMHFLESPSSGFHVILERNQMMHQDIIDR